MTKRNHTPINEINQRWVERKHVCEKSHRYAGTPEIAIIRCDVDIRVKSSTKPKEMPKFKN